MAETSKKSKANHVESQVQVMDGHSYSPQQELLGLLRSRCPEVFTEGKIDAGKLTQTLGEEIETNSERYGLTWAGKAECFRHIQQSTTATLKPLRAESVDFDATENIFIEGDNLEVLKILQKTYQNKIKMIYIDPPYNTGSDSFIYPDRFKEEKEDYEQRAGIKDAEGLLTKDGFWRKNSKDAGHFHSNWLSMMYPRLFLAKNLLREDGVIFVSIDDNEVHNLRMIMNEIFGEENFVASIVWQHSIQPKGYTGIFSIHHNHLLCFKRSEAFEVGVLSRTEEHNKNYSNPDNDPRGLWRTGDVRNALYRPNLIFDITTPSGKIIEPPKNGWRWSKQTIQKKIESGEIIFSKDESRIIRKIYLADVEGRTPESMWFGKDVGTTRDAVAEIKQLFDDQTPFETPKPTGIIKRMAEVSCSPDEEDIVLDFFAGSCTTAHAVMALNAEDGGNRKFICIQLAEPCEEKSEAFKAGFKTIADIGKERIRRAAKKIRNETEGNLKFDKGRLDLGFKVFRLDQSSFKQWREHVKTGEELKEQMRMFVDNVKKGAATEDMLFEIVLKNSRFDLNVKVEKGSCDGVGYYRLADGVEIVCLADKITKKLVEKILKEKPERFTCLDIAFKNNDQLKTNTALQMEAEKIEFKVI
jgi:adenine-specific DNA-methyltransferase